MQNIRWNWAINIFSSVRAGINAIFGYLLMEDSDVLLTEDSEKLGW
jgi:hypothetical protein